MRLLVFDNCEDLRDAAADVVEAVLVHSATVTVLATGRAQAYCPWHTKGMAEGGV